jgi:hypothetical protein
MHPDKGGDAAAFARLNSAFETLSDPDRLQQWRQSRCSGVATASESVDIDALAYDAAAACFRHRCRCGDDIVAREDMLDLGCVPAAPV